MRFVLGLMLAVVLAGADTVTAALAMTTERWEADRIVAEAVTQLHEARDDAVAQRLRLVSAYSEARHTVDRLKELVSLAPGWVDADEWTAYAALFRLLEDQLSDASISPIPLLEDTVATSPERTRRWLASFGAWKQRSSGAADRLDATQQDVLSSLWNLACSAVKGGPALASFSKAGPDLLKAAQDELALVSDHTENGTDPGEALIEYTRAWIALRDAHVAAESRAAAPAGSTGSGGAGYAVGGPSAESPSLPGSWTPPVLFADPWIPVAYWFTGARVARCPGDPQSGYGNVDYVEYYDIYPGIDVYYYNAATYSTVVNEEERYLLILICA